MSETWKNQEFEGSGLQSINVLYNQKRKKTSTAYLLTTLFPIGCHQLYLGRYKFSLIYLTLSAACVLTWAEKTSLFSFFLLVMIALLIYDITQMEKRVNNYNKQLKMMLSLQHNNQPPKDFHGRYTDENPLEDYLAVKNNEKPANNKILSFAEQEKLLKEFHQKKNN